VQKYYSYAKIQKVLKVEYALRALGAKRVLKMWHHYNLKETKRSPAPNSSLLKKPLQEVWWRIQNSQSKPALFM
jgi:hypothetical protein